MCPPSKSVHHSSTEWKFVVSAHHFIFWPSAESICRRNMYQHLFDGGNPSQLKGKEEQRVASKTLLPDESGMVGSSSWLLSAINHSVKGNRPILCIVFALNTLLTNWVIEISAVLYPWGIHQVRLIKVGDSALLGPSWSTAGGGIECRPPRLSSRWKVKGISYSVLTQLSTFYTLCSWICTAILNCTTALPIVSLAAV